MVYEKMFCFEFWLHAFEQWSFLSRERIKETIVYRFFLFLQDRGLAEIKIF
jgi:hypothetical protein